VCNDNHCQDNRHAEETLSKTADGKPVVTIVFIEEIVIEFFVVRGRIKDNSMGYKCRFESIVQVRYQSEVVNWHKRN
jgi:hypothetical protein